MYLPNLLSGEPSERPGMIELLLRWYARLYERFGETLKHAFEASWAWLKEAFVTAYRVSWTWLKEVGKTVDNPLQEHPYVALFASFLIFLGPWILLLPLFLLQAIFFVVLHILGFGLSGITGGSPAALYQSFCYGGHTPANSLFAMMQSIGTQYNVRTASNWVLVTIRVLAGVVGIYVLVGILQS